MSAARRHDGLLPAFCFHAVARFFNESPGQEGRYVIRKPEVELRLNREPIHIESVACIKKPAAVTDGQTARVFGEPAERYMFFQECRQFSAKGRTRFIWMRYEEQY